MNHFDFKVRFPEFKTAGDPLIQSCLDQAAAHVSAAVLGALYDEAHGLKAADMLARSPGAIAARLVQKDGSTTYSRQFSDCLRAKVVGVTYG